MMPRTVLSVPWSRQSRAILIAQGSPARDKGPAASAVPALSNLTPYPSSSPRRTGQSHRAPAPFTNCQRMPVALRINLRQPPALSAQPDAPV